MSSLKQKYHSEVREELRKKFDYKNPHLIPSLKKIVISMGMAETARDKNALKELLDQLSLLSGQKALVTRARKSIAGFKLREGMPVGAKVTLRGKRMYDFLMRFIHIAAPRIRDFRGFPTKMDGRGSYSLGLKEQVIFPELNLDLVKVTQGMNITFTTSAKTDQEGFELLSLLGLPFKKPTKRSA